MATINVGNTNNKASMTTNFKIQSIEFKMNKTSYRIEVDNLNGLIVEESIYRKGIYAKLSFLDYNNYLEKLPITGGELLYVKLLDDFNQMLNLVFVVDQVETISPRDATNLKDIQLGLYERKYFDIMTKNYPYGVTDQTSTISDILYKIMTNIYNKDLYINKNKQLPNIVPNLYFPVFWNIDYIINYLLGISRVQSDSGFRFIYNRIIDKFEIISEVSLQKQIQTKNTKYFTFTDKYDQNYIKNYEILPSKALTELSNQNLLHHFSYTYNNNNKKLIVQEHNLENYLEEFNISNLNVSQEGNILSKENNKNYEYQPYKYDGSIIGEINNYKSKKYGNNLIMTIEIYGRLDIYIGEKIFLKFPVGTPNVPQIHYGEWVISDIDHHFNANMTYSQNITLIKNNIKDEFSDSRLVKRI